MAWIELHQTLPTHKKTSRLVRALHMSVPKDNPTVVGHLCVFWLWCLDGADEGRLRDMTAQDIADAAMWTGDPDEFLTAMIKAGFIDETDNGLRIHDWDDYIGRLIAFREKERARNRVKQARHRERIKLAAQQETHTEPTEPADPYDTEFGIDKDWRKVVLCYESNIGSIPYGVAGEKLVSYKNDLGADVVCMAIKMTNKAQADNPWRYLNKILANWAEKGINTVEAAEAYSKDWERRLDAAKKRKSKPIDSPNEPPAISGDFY